MKEALENIASVKRLDRTGEGRNLVVDAYPRLLDPLQTQDQVFGGIVAGHSMTVDNTRGRMVEWMEASGNRCLWPIRALLDRSSLAIIRALWWPRGHSRLSDYRPNPFHDSSTSTIARPAQGSRGGAGPSL